MLGSLRHKMGYFSSLYKQRIRKRKEGNFVPLAESNIKPYAMQYPELTEEISNKLMNNL